MTEYPSSTDELRAFVARIEDELAELWLSSFTPDDARRLGLILVRLAQERELPVAIDIRRGKHLVFHVAMPGATENNDDWISRKVRTVERFEQPSLLVGMAPRVHGKRVEDEGWFDELEFAAHGGCFPVQVRGAGMVATVTVSGLPQIADHDLVVEALREFIATA